MWNYRVMCKQYNNESKTIELSINEVYYDKNNIPTSYIENNQIKSEDKKGLKWSLKVMKFALKKPVISKDNFPQEVKLQYECDFCKKIFKKAKKHKCQSKELCFTLKIKYDR